MPDNENTITTIFQADISQFSSSTQQLNQYIRTINSEFANATAGMGKWSDSTDGLQAKITQLNGILDAEKKKLANLESQYKALQDAGEGNSYQARQLAIQINNQKAVIGKTEKQVDEYTKSLKELTDAGVKTRQELDDLNKKVKDNGEASESTAKKIMGGLGKGLLGIAGATAGAVTGFLALGESTRDFRKEQAQLETAFVTAGHSAETMKKTYAEFNAVLGDTSKTTEAMQQLAQFTKSEEELADYTNILTGVFATYGEALSTEGLAEGINHTIKLGEVQGSLADALEWGGISVDDFNAKLEKCSTEQERNALISETLNKLYGEQAQHYKENNKDIIEAEKAQTRLTQAMATLGAVAEPIMTMLKNALAGLLEAIQPFVKLVGEGLKGAFEGAKDGASKLAQGLTGLAESLINKVSEMIPKVVDIILKLIPSIISSIANAIPSLISTLASVVSQVISALGTMIPSIIQTIIDTIPQWVQAIMDALPVLLDGITQLVMGIVEALPSLIQSLLQALPMIIQTIIDGLNSFIPQLIEAAITLLMAIVDAIPTLLQAINDNLPKIITTIIDGLLSMIPQLIDGAIKLLMSFIEALPTLIQALVKEIPTIVTTIVRVLTSRIDDVINGAIELLSGIISAIPMIISQLIKEMPTIIKTMVEGLIDGIPDMIKAGADLLGGLFEGLLNPKVIWENIKKLGNSILDNVKSFFGIKSPSRLFKEEIGENLALGIGEGFDDEIGAVTKDMKKSLKGLNAQVGIDAKGFDSINSLKMPNQNMFGELVDLIKSLSKGNVINNYNFDYSFEKMETSKLALHKAVLETKRAIGG